MDKYDNKLLFRASEAGVYAIASPGKEIILVPLEKWELFALSSEEDEVTVISNLPETPDSSPASIGRQVLKIMALLTLVSCASLGSAPRHEPGDCIMDRYMDTIIQVMGSSKSQYKLDIIIQGQVHIVTVDSKEFDRESKEALDGGLYIKLRCSEIGIAQ